MWHGSVENWVCYCMFCSKRMKVFPWVAWPDLLKDGDVMKWYQSMSDCSGVSFPDLWVTEGHYKLVLELQFQHWAWMGQKGSSEENIYRRLISKWPNFKSRSVDEKYWRAGVHGKFWAPHRKRWCVSVHGKLWHRVEEYCVHMYTMNLALHSEHTHSNVHMGCVSIA
jgi:hypothetical protein